MSALGDAIRPTPFAPFPYFGGKRHIAPVVWRLLGDPAAYVEPFAGSAAVLLGRPAFQGKRREVINDLDGWITNLWRSIRDRPDDVARHATGPVMELDLHARLAWLKEQQTPELVSWLEGDPEHCDPKAAGWWLYSTIGSIAGGTRPGPWRTDGMHLTKASGTRDGIVRSIPHISQGRSFNDVRPNIALLAKRLEDVIITCGDWKRPLSKALRPYSAVGVLLDPPYEERSRTADGHTLYAQDCRDASEEVRTWCRDMAPKDWRVVLCGYGDEHDELLANGWRKVTPPKHQSSGYNMSGLNGQRDRLWVSPNCLDEQSQGSILDMLGPSDSGSAPCP